MSILIRDVEFSSDMILELLENFDGDFPDCLNSFNEGERLECLSSGDLSTRLQKSFRVDAEKVRNILKIETMTQSQLVLLTHSAIECANKLVKKDPGPRKKAPGSSGGGSKKQKASRLL